MSEIPVLLLLCFAITAVLCDLKTGRIPNGIITAGLACGALYQISEKGAVGIVLYLGGACLPILFLGVFFYFRMIGAGDVKLLCMAGAFFGPSGSFVVLKWSILFGGAASLVYMLRRGNMWERLLFFREYASQYSRSHSWRPYMSGVGESAKFCFSVPILAGILCQIGGSI